MKLLRCVRDLPACLLVDDSPLWSWEALPQALAQGPPKRFWADVMAHLARSAGVPRVVPVAAAARPVRPPVVRTARPATLPSPTTPRASPRLTANRVAFFSAVEAVPATEALRSIRQAHTAASTKVTYRAVVPLYERACAKGHMAPSPPSRDTLELFAGYLRVSGVFASPSTYWWAIVDESRERRCDFRLDRD